MKMVKLVPTWFLKILVRRNFRLRMQGKLPDEWHWGDIQLCIRDCMIPLGIYESLIKRF